MTLEGNYMILLVHDAYDVPYRSQDGDKQDDASSEVFSYILCSVCPVKLTKPALSYYVQQNEFHNRTADWVVAPPELGFLFPAFDDRAANLYNALYYTKHTEDIQSAVVEAVFGADAPMPADEQQAAFHTVLEESLEEECCLQVVQAVHDQLCGLMEDHKESHEAEPLVIGKERSARPWRPTESPRSTSMPLRRSTTRASGRTPSSAPGIWWIPGAWRSRRRM